MMRETLDADSAHAMMIVSAGKGLAFQRRATTAGVSVHTSGGGGAAPQWVRLTRSGHTFIAARSADGTTWTTVGTETIAMAPTIYVGIPITSHRDGSLASASVTNVTVTDATTGPGGTLPAALPAGWASADIGAVGVSGSATYMNGTLRIDGSGRDIWGSSDEFHFVYRTMTGDGSVTARVNTLEAVDAWTKAGVMMRETLAAGARHAMVIVSPGKGLNFQQRVSIGGSTTHTAAGAATAPHWVRLTRVSNVFTAAVSPDGNAWTTVGAADISMTGTIYVGLPVTSHSDGTLGTATFDHVAVEQNRGPRRTRWMCARARRTPCGSADQPTHPRHAARYERRTGGADASTDSSGTSTASAPMVMPLTHGRMACLCTSPPSDGAVTSKASTAPPRSSSRTSWTSPSDRPAVVRTRRCFRVLVLAAATPCSRHSFAPTTPVAERATTASAPIA